MSVTGLRKAPLAELVVCLAVVVGWPGRGVAVVVKVGDVFGLIVEVWEVVVEILGFKVVVVSSFLSTR